MGARRDDDAVLEGLREELVCAKCVSIGNEEGKVMVWKGEAVSDDEKFVPDC